MIYAYTRPRYQVSVYRTIGPLVFKWEQNIQPLVFSSPVQSTGRAIVVTLASALALTLAIPFPSRHF